MTELAALGPAWRPLIAAVCAEFVAVQPSEGALNALCGLFDRVVEWNRRADLTAARSAEELVDLYVADAACLASVTDPSARERWLDVGSGAGAPALPLAILRPELEFELVEPRAKRVAFLRTVIGALTLPNARVQRGTSHEVADQSVDVAVSRATLPPNEWLREGTRIATRAVWVLLAQHAPPRASGWQSARDVAYRWPLTNAQRRAVQFVRNP